MNPQGSLRPAAKLSTVTLVLLVIISPAHAQLTDLPPTPEWIQPAGAQTNQPIFARKMFEAPQRLLKAILLGACEGTMTISINGAEAASISSRDRAASVDVTQFLRAGTNLLAVRAMNPKGLAAISLLLEVNGDLGRRHWVASDISWLTSTVASPGWNTPEFVPKDWTGAKRLRPVVAAEANPFDPNKVFDAYNSWKLALNTNAATATEGFNLLPGFRVELVRSAQPGEGSWVAMAFDPQGRLTLAREQRGLLRLRIDSGGVNQIESINDTLLECRGLLYADGALYANANNSKRLYRLRDTDNDGKFDEVIELLHTGGSVGHGRNHLKLGPDGWIYLAHGNNVALYTNLAPSSALKHYADDQLIPCPWDRQMFDGDVDLPAGHVLRFRPGTQPLTVEIVAGGFRNPLDVAFNRDGEMFTFDADMEWDVGTPWYAPNRVLHVVSGADFGWRRGTGRFPPHYADTLPSTLDIGLASPTAVSFGYGSRFPAKYQEALYILDWAYGRILAVHLRPRGASYSAASELFISGRPLNVTDACIGPDGAMWFITGGRRTQSGLYRVTHPDGETREQSVLPETVGEPAAAAARSVRRRLELFHRGVKPNQQPEALATIWPHLGDDDRWIRHAARVALENIDPTLWQQRALQEAHPTRALTALLALVRVGGGTNLQTLILNRLDPLLSSCREEEQVLIGLRLYGLIFARLGSPNEAARRNILDQLEALYPAASWPVNHELCELLIYMRSPTVISKTLDLLRSASRSEDLLQYLFYLRYTREGWNLDQRRHYFEALARADSLPGARQYVKALEDIRREVTAALTPGERDALGPLLTGPHSVAAVSPRRGPIIKEWKLDDLVPLLGRVANGRSFAGGKVALMSAQCVACHRVSLDTSVPAGLVGPDLMSVGSRFNRRDLLDQILNPSKVVDEKFRATTFILKDETELTGTIEREDETQVVIRINPLSAETTTIARGSILKRQPSSLSPMPAGLLDHLELEQILDLLAFLEAGGDPNGAAFRHSTSAQRPP